MTKTQKAYQANKTEEPAPPLRRALLPPLVFMAALALLVAVFYDSGHTTSGRRAQAEKTAVSVTQRYNQAKKTAFSLARENARPYAPQTWEKLAAEFKAIYEEYPQWPNRPAALFRMAKSLEEMARRSADAGDARRAVARYEELASTHPESCLADDALYNAARIQAVLLKDDDAALALVALLKQRHPRGDMLPDALALEKRLVHGKTSAQAMTPGKPEALKQNAPIVAGDAAPKIAPKTETRSEKTAQMPKREGKPEARPATAPAAPVTTSEPDPEKFTPPPGIEDTSARSAAAPRQAELAKTGKDKTAARQALAQIVPQSGGEVELQSGRKAETEFVKLIPAQKRESKPAATSAEAISLRPSSGALPVPELPPLPLLPLAAAHSERAKAASGKTAGNDMSGISDKTETEQTSAAPRVDKRTALAVPPNEDRLPSMPRIADIKPLRIRLAAAAQPRPSRVPPTRADIRALAMKNMAGQLGLTVGKIFIDAGHGGKDPGASAHSLTERDITLDIALALGRILETNGFEVLHSRSGDIGMPLGERATRANEAMADLFVSLHVNANPTPSINGFETYYLNFASSPDAARVAALENAVGGQRLGEMQRLMGEVLLNARVDESRRLAGDIQRQVVKRIKAENFSVRDNGVKSAPFHVLIGARMPAVLVELGYCTNKSEAARLADPVYRRLLAEGLAEGVMAYRERLDKGSNMRAETGAF
ncbi:MAG: N-acetylmuramoyl-L-alanine amidase [Desulfovibrio sp.]|nr:N-acetylmuramoyl-L-alanine amidase [Desulfovibrio sp.]